MANARMFVPVDGAGLDWPRRVANAVNALLTRADAYEARVADLEARMAAAEARLTDLETP